jgi:hypothetical protein
VPISTAQVLLTAKYFVHEKTYFFNEKTFYVKVSKATPEQLSSPSAFQMIEDEDIVEALAEMDTKAVSEIWKIEKRIENGDI